MNPRYYPSFFKLLAALLLVIAFSATATAQIKRAPGVPLADLKLKADTVSREFSISFRAQEMVANLLVRITDSKGETVFLDNEYRFKGDYKQIMKRADLPAGEYTIEILKDDDDPVTQKVKLK
jgi:hypothetical protein